MSDRSIWLVIRDTILNVIAKTPTIFPFGKAWVERLRDFILILVLTLAIPVWIYLLYLIFA